MQGLVKRLQSADLNKVVIGVSSGLDRRVMLRIMAFLFALSLNDLGMELNNGRLSATERAGCDRPLI